MSRSGAERPIRSLGDSLRRLTDELGLGEVSTAAGVMSCWADAVGPDVAEHARPVKLRDGVLTVEAEDPAWASQLRYLGSDLVDRLNRALGTEDVREVRIVVARSGEGDRRGGRPPRG